MHPTEFGSTFDYLSELLFYEEMRVKVLVESSTCERNTHGKTVLVMFDLKQRLLVNKKILCAFYGQSTVRALSFQSPSLPFN